MAEGNVVLPVMIVIGLGGLYHPTVSAGTNRETIQMNACTGLNEICASYVKHS
jgi:hypothetical protein